MNLNIIISAVTWSQFLFRREKYSRFYRISEKVGTYLKTEIQLVAYKLIVNFYDSNSNLGQKIEKLIKVNK
jgi:hypothetical protein